MGIRCKLCVSKLATAEKRGYCGATAYRRVAGDDGLNTGIETWNSRGASTKTRIET